ncbi:acetylxylan esterase [Metabacillus mangrovi]|uniref:acetylxylan esterase n=1 Tax=Metabacillus mangrovi TaxID=1491830 RepID=UPI0013919B47|nr:acetylxylan esterase [Metabacillus mangrovi]
MNAIQKRIEELKNYSAEPTIDRESLKTFWQKQHEQEGSYSLNVHYERADSIFPSIETYHVTYYGADGTPIRARLSLPRFSENKPLPCALVFHGYGDSKGFEEKHAALLLMGIAVFAADVRGQGGETGSLLKTSYGTSPGWVTQGILNPANSYYSSIVSDALRAISAADSHPDIDSAKLFAVGLSQGGGLALLAAALTDSKLKFVSAALPGMCHMDLGIMKSTGSLSEAAAFIHKHPEHTDTVLRSLSYFDVLNHSEQITIPVHMQIGLKDTVCLPDCIAAAYNRISSRKTLDVHPFAGHEMTEHVQRNMLQFVKNELER